MIKGWDVVMGKNKDQKRLRQVEYFKRKSMLSEGDMEVLDLVDRLLSLIEEAIGITSDSSIINNEEFSVSAMKQAQVEGQEKGILVWHPQRGVRRLKPGVTIETYRERVPSTPQAIEISRIPKFQTLERWIEDGVARAIDGCRVEIDGDCPHGYPAWTKYLGFV